MSEKSHVSLEQHLCEVCATPYDTGAILLHKRLRPVLEHKTLTAHAGLCPECKAKADEGYIALVEAASPAGDHSNRLKQEHANRTGRIFHVRAEAFARMFNVAPDPGKPMVFIDEQVGDMLVNAMPPA